VVFEKWVLKRTFRPQWEAVREDGRMFCNEKHHDFHTIQNMNMVIWVGHMVIWERKEIIAEIWLENLGGNISLGRHKCRWGRA
jgi:hypothetical protein